jgi:DNA-binding HxlR family transcriptional regulator
MSTDGLAHALSVVGDRWTLQIIADLLDGPKRFGELSEALPDIAPNVLTGRLRQLVRDHLVTVTPYSRRPLRMSYGVSEAGRDLHGALVLLAAWGARRTGEPHAGVHEACGTHFEARLYCPTCEQTVDDPQAETLHWA